MFKKMFKNIGKFLDWLTEFDRKMAEEGYIIHYPPPGAGSMGGCHITYIGKPPKKHPKKTTHINKSRHDRPGTLSGDDPRA
jgi:hypothetical protein